MSLPSVLDEIDRLFDELVCRPWGAGARQLEAAQFHDVKDGWIVELPVEGLQAADLKIKVQDRQLTVNGLRRDEHRHRQGGRWTRTQQTVSWQRTFPLPAEADPSDIQAAVHGSTLSIHIGRRKR